MYLMMLGSHGEPAHVGVDVHGLGQTAGGLCYKKMKISSNLLFSPFTLQLPVADSNP